MTPFLYVLGAMVFFYIYAGEELDREGFWWQMLTAAVLVTWPIWLGLLLVLYTARLFGAAIDAFRGKQV